MYRLAAFFGLLGLAVATGVVIWGGYGSVLQALQVAGWGIVWTSLYHILPILASSLSWQVLVPGRKRPSLGFFLYVMWLRGAINNLMPVARIGGEIVSVRVMTRYGMRMSVAVSSTIVELTLSIVAVFLFVLSGVFLLSLRIGEDQLGWKITAGLLASVPLIAALIAVQRVGFFGILDKIFTVVMRDTWKKFAGTNLGQLDKAIHAVYRRRWRVVLSFLLLLLSWSAWSGEIWFGLVFLGHRLPFADCFIFEALIQGTASVAFAIPGALGAQEAGFLFFGHLLGLPSDIAVALAVIRRCRDLLIYVPGLVAWQVQEGKWLLRKKITS